MAATPSSAHNTAAWALSAKTRPFVVSSAPYHPPPPGHVVIKVESVAINPIDWIMQDRDIFGAKYPAIFGSDLAGVIVQRGEGVVGFGVGQRVIAHAHGLSTNNPSYGALQQYVSLLSYNYARHPFNKNQTAPMAPTLARDTLLYVLSPAISTAPLPSSIPLQHAVALPLSISTAAAGLYQRNTLSLPYPTSTTPPPPLNRTLIIWGGSSSVGSTATQLARASGATIVAVASARNFEYCLALGAERVIDYHDPSVEDGLVQMLKGATLAGVYHAAGGEEAVRACARVAERCEGKAIVVTVGGVPKEGIPESVRVVGIRSSDIFGEGAEVGRRIWGEYVPLALERGLLVPAPEAVVVGRGLRSVQRGVDVLRRGVSARKVVVDGIGEDASRETVLGRIWDC